MEKIVYNSEYFSPKDTLNCGQIFRFFEYKKGYIVLSKDKACYLYCENDKTIIECENADKNYFYNYFDLDRDYSKIVNNALKENNFLSFCAKMGKGIRILNQDKEEMLYSFIVSQNNNIPRIKLILNRMSEKFGEKKHFLVFEYYSFPKSCTMAKYELKCFKDLGLGYRDSYIEKLSKSITNGFDVEKLNELNTNDLKKELLKIYGVGPKVADCVSLFGFHRANSFPVDTWIERVYKENLNGELTDRKKISQFLADKYGENAGYFQQYMFYYKRSIENGKK